MMTKTRILIALLALAMPFAASAQDTLDELLQQVQQAAQEEQRAARDKVLWKMIKKAGVKPWLNYLGKALGSKAF